jgi:hypothetical protein
MRQRWTTTGSWRAWVLLLGLVAGCNPHAWAAHPMSTPPDRTCRVGVESVWDVYIWECVRDQRVVVAQFGTYFGPHEAEKEVAACGAKTSLEEKILGQGARCDPVPSTFEWQTAP